LIVATVKEKAFGNVAIIPKSVHFIGGFFNVARVALAAWPVLSLTLARK